MEITLFRHPGYFGRGMHLDVFANDQKVASLQSGTSQKISLPDGDVTLRVEMQDAFSSPALKISSRCNGQHFECGTPLWVLFDVMSLFYLPYLKRRVFFLRAASSSAPPA